MYHTNNTERDSTNGYSTFKLSLLLYIGRECKSTCLLYGSQVLYFAYGISSTLASSGFSKTAGLAMNLRS